MVERVKIAIENLYDIFSKYPGNPQMAGSPIYGNLDGWNSKLFSKKLRELNEDDLNRFTGKSMTTWGNVDDYKHFLPRIFELMAYYKTPYDIWIAFNKLEYGNWENWKENEREGIVNFMLALFENIISDNSELAESNFFDYFTAISYYYPNFLDILEIMEKDKSKSKYKHLTNLINDHGVSIFDRGNLNRFEKTNRNVEELKNWLLRNQFLEEIGSAFFKFENEEFSERLSWAEQTLCNEIKNKS
jgi:hypothetical protein